MCTLALLKVGMVGGMWLGVDFTTGMRYQRESRAKWRMKKTPSGKGLGGIHEAGREREEEAGAGDWGAGGRRGGVHYEQTVTGGGGGGGSVGGSGNSHGGAEAVEPRIVGEARVAANVHGPQVRVGPARDGDRHSSPRQCMAPNDPVSPARALHRDVGGGDGSGGVDDNGGGGGGGGSGSGSGSDGDADKEASLNGGRGGGGGGDSRGGGGDVGGDDGDAKSASDAKRDVSTRRQRDALGVKPRSTTAPRVGTILRHPAHPKA